MRKVRIPNDRMPPAEWLAEAEAACIALAEAKTVADRDAIIEARQMLWRDDRIRDWLLGTAKLRRQFPRTTSTTTDPRVG